MKHITVGGDMKNMVKKQRGVTFIGWCIILAIIGFFVLITLRLFPLYNEMFEVITAMKSVGTRNGAETMGQREILTAFVRTAQTGGINPFMVFCPALFLCTYCLQG